MRSKSKVPAVLLWVQRETKLFSTMVFSPKSQVLTFWIRQSNKHTPIVFVQLAISPFANYKFHWNFIQWKSHFLKWKRSSFSRNNVLERWNNYFAVYLPFIDNNFPSLSIHFLAEKSTSQAFNPGFLLLIPRYFYCIKFTVLF